MKRASLFTLLFFWCIATKAQSLSFKDLIAILGKQDWESVNTMVLNKGWTYFESKEGGLLTYTKITWTFGKSYYDDKALGWLHLYCDEDKPQKVTFQFHTKAVYSIIQNSIISSGFKKDGSSILNDEIVVEYSSKNYAAKLSTSKSDGDFSSSTVYYVTVFKNYSLPSPSLEKIDLPIKRNGLIKTHYTDGVIESETMYLNDKKNGISKEYDPYGTLISHLTYKNDILDGPYKKYTSEGNPEIEGFYKNDLRNGLHTIYYYSEDGSLYYKSTGSYKNDTLIGRWNDIYSIKGKNIIVVYETYENDELAGPFKRIEGDSIIFGTYKDRELNGSYKIYIDHLTKDGEMLFGDTTKAYLKESGVYTSGLREGLWKFYSKEKTLIEESTFASGSRAGICKFYFPKQNISMFVNYDLDLVIDETFYVYKTTKLFSGILNIYNDETGKITEIVAISEGKRNGMTKYLDDDGEIINEVEFVNGKIKE